MGERVWLYPKRMPDGREVDKEFSYDTDVCSIAAVERLKFEQQRCYINSLYIIHITPKRMTNKQEI